MVKPEPDILLSRIRVSRYHDLSAGHRIVGHSGGCSALHGHNYRITFTVEGPRLNNLGMLVDFSVIKEKLCTWLDHEWDHRLLLWDRDPILDRIMDIDDRAVSVPFNPTAENMAAYLVNVVGPEQLFNTPVYLVECRVQETRKCSAIYCM